MNAFHSSASSQTMYVGFGASFKPMRPFTSPPSQLKAAYDVSAYDGITFRAKTGGGPTTQPMYVEILAKESQPSTSGGTATTTTIDLYNTRGQIVTVSSSTYTQFFVPFGTLIPRWLPAVGSGMVCPAAGGSVPKCQAAKFVPANALGLQFSFYNDAGFPKPSPAGSYNLFIDDVSFYKRSQLPSGTSDLPALPSTAGAAHPFPQNSAINSRCSKAAGADGKLLATAYKNWKDNFVRTDGSGFKIIRPENGNDTVSEGIAYGMMISVYMNDKALFDGLYTYWKAHIASNSLMTWCIPSGGGSCAASGGTATDADEDAAFAMLMASKQWSGGSYAADATTLMHGVLAADMSGSYIKAGSNYNASGITNPSYFAPAFYRAFAAADTANATAWNNLATGAYTLLNAISGSSSNGLVPAWCAGGSCNAPASNGAATDTIYQYDSHRVPWRIGMDYCWNNTAAAKTYVDKTSAFFSGKGANGIGRIYDLYNLNGMEASGAAVNSASIIGTAAAGAMANTSYATFMNDGYQLVFDLLNRGVYGYDGVNKSAYSYFNATVGMLMLLTMSGNFILF
jgi:endo-1,4-beta-D-glucanase Y